MLPVASEKPQTYGINVKTFGACGNGDTDDSVAIQAALDAGQPLVTIPYGSYKIAQPLKVRSNTRLLVHPLARLFLADHAGVGPDSFLLTNQDYTGGNRNIRIEGGIWDGNNVHNRRGPNQPDSYTGVLINFTNVDGLTLRSLTLRDAESYFIRFGKVTNFTVEQIKFEALHLRPNQDGLHISGFCQDGLIRHLRAFGPQTPNDDVVALLADDALHRAQNLGAFNGPIRRIRVYDIRAESCHSFVRLLSYQNPIEDVDISNVHGGCRCCAINMDACRDCAVTLFDEADYPAGVGNIARVHVQNMHVHRTSARSKQPLIDLRTRVRDFVVEDFRRDTWLDVAPDTPTLLATKASELNLILTGLTTEQVANLQQSSLLAQSSITTLASINEETLYQGRFTVDQNQRLVLPNGEFSMLQVNY